MDGQKFVEWFFNFSEKVVAYIINTFFVILFALPLILVDLTFSENMVKMPLFFIPLATLYLVALKCTIYAVHQVFVKDGMYYIPYFLRSLIDRFFANYLFNLVALTFLYIGVNSAYILIDTISKWFYILLFSIIFLLIPIVLYTNMQYALYEKTKFKDILSNSVILTFMYGIISIIIAFGFAFLVYRFQFNPFLVVTVGIAVLAGILVFVNTLILKNQKQ